MNESEILRWLATGSIAILTAITMFTMKDLYRRLRNVEEAKELTVIRLTAIDTNLQNNVDTLKSIEKSVRNLVELHLKEPRYYINDADFDKK